jgi:hypothetical protein
VTELYDRMSVGGDDRAMGRIPEWDPRSDNYRISRFIPQFREPRSYSWPIYLPITDQDGQGACVGFTILEELASTPQIVKGLTNRDGFDLYWDIQDTDQWAGSERPGDPAGHSEGTSVHAAARLMKDRGLWAGYLWAKTVEELREAVCWHGPVPIGVDWFTGSMETDDGGYVHPTGVVEGGHAVLIRGYSRMRQAFRGRNHWTSGWGVRGEFWIREQEMPAYMNDAEICLPTRTKLTAMP